MGRPMTPDGISGMLQPADLFEGVGLTPRFFGVVT
jgi:hypothetical protein